MSFNIDSLREILDNIYLDCVVYCKQGNVYLLHSQLQL